MHSKNTAQESSEK